MRDAPADTRGLATDLLVVLGARGVATAAVLSTGFLALSDDDYARAVLAERWAAAPRLDPTGTSWLPLPFWITGLAMRAFGRSLDVARAVGIGLGFCAALLTCVAARWLLGPGRGAGAASGLAMLLPSAAVLGVAAVPELPVAALTLLALASLVSGRATSVIAADVGTSAARRRVLGALALFAATLSRYEPWPVAAAFSAFCFADAARARREGQAASVRAFSVAGVLALVGPAAWLAWNQRAHGDPFSFARRVASYRRALGEGGGGAFESVLTYLSAAARAEAAVVALVAVAFVMLAFRRFRPFDVREHLARHVRPAVVCAATVLALGFAAARDGAPTHHPERALLVVALWGAVLAVHLHLAIARHARGVWTHHVGAGLAALGVAAWVSPSGAGPTGEQGRRRAEQEAIGRAAGAVVPPAAKVLVQVEDYGWLAVAAAFGRPEDLVPDRHVDPRAQPRPDSFADVERLVHRIDETGATHVIATATAAALGTSRPPPLVTSGRWALFDVSSLAVDHRR